MKVLAVTSEIPWPLDSGGRLRTFHVMKALSEAHDLQLVVPVTPLQAGHVQALGKQGIGIMPVPVVPRTKWSEARRLLSSRLRGLPYAMYGRHARHEVFEAFERELRHQPDVVWLDHIDSLLYAPDNVKMVIDLHNIYSLILDRLAEESANPLKRWFLRGEAKRLARREEQAAKQCDTLIAVSATESLHFQSIGARRVIVAPNGVNCAAFADLPTGRAGAKPIILFLGTLSWGPNVTAAVTLAKEIFPAVREAIPNAELWLVGRDPSLEVQALACEGVTVKGSVPEIRPYLEQAAVLAVPIDSGGGTRLKILEAFAAGLPVVSTAVGAEGIDAVHGEHIVIAERDEMAASIVKLLNDGTFGNAMTIAGRRLVNEVYDWSRIGRICIEAVEGLSEGFDSK